jgi:hypothetical protein
MDLDGPRWTSYSSIFNSWLLAGNRGVICRYPWLALNLHLLGGFPITTLDSPKVAGIKIINHNND